MSSAEPQSESPEPIFERIDKSFTPCAIGCWECMAEFFSNLWDHICDVYYCVLDWTCENICCYCNGDSEPENKVTRQQNANKNSPRGRVNKAQPPDLQQVTVIKSSTQKTVNSPQSPSASISPSPPPPPSPPPSNAKPTSPQQQQHPQSPQQQQQQQNPPVANQPAAGNQPPNQEPTEVPHVEPPRIDFVETGSIFGDRKRGGPDLNLLLLENGRFRSPGTSKVVHGPGGRTIRVSFVSGFPQLKSIDSNKSLATVTSKILAKKSFESSSSSTDKGGPTDVKIRKFKSATKSYKSVSSSESKEQIQDRT